MKEYFTFPTTRQSDRQTVSQGNNREENNHNGNIRRQARQWKQEQQTLVSFCNLPSAISQFHSEFSSLRISSCDPPSVVMPTNMPSRHGVNNSLRGVVYFLFFLKISFSRNFCFVRFSSKFLSGCCNEDEYIIATEDDDDGEGEAAAEDVTDKEEGASEKKVQQQMKLEK